MAKRTIQSQKHSFLLSLRSLTFLSLLPPISATYPSNPNDNNNATDFIRTSCNVTLYPDICYTSLSRYATAVQQNSGLLARIAVAVSLTKARHMSSYVSNLSHLAESGIEPLALAVLHDCHSTFSDAIDQIHSSLVELRRVNTGGESFRFHMGNVQTWMSAALTNEDTCTDEFDDVPDGPMKSDVCNRVGKVKKYTSNALALVNSFAAKEAY